MSQMESRLVDVEAGVKDIRATANVDREAARSGVEELRESMHQANDRLQKSFETALARSKSWTLSSVAAFGIVVWVTTRLLTMYLGYINVI